MKIETQTLFENSKIKIGITLKNALNFPPNGFSIGKAGIYSSNEVESMRLELAKEVGFHINDMIFLNQTHSNIISKIDNFNQIESDGILLNSSINKCINISVADCIGLYLWDDDYQYIIGVHSGWKGTQQNIASKALELLLNNLDAKKVNALISPSASFENYEVGETFKEIFSNNTHFNKDKGKFYFDNKKEVKEQLIAMGLNENKIFTSPECTIENGNYHSFRRDKSLSGRMSVFGYFKN